jgi:hypothetical protein
MARQSQCMFCQEQAGSREHLWAAWIHRRIRRRQPIRIDFADRPIKMSNDPEIKVKTVCGTCNNGWMSSLEQSCIPLIGSLMQDLAVPLDPVQQKLLSTWAVKTAIVLDSTNTRKRNLFYDRNDCENLRLSSTIPKRIGVWIGRSALDGLHADATDVLIERPTGTKIAIGNAATMIVGHLAVQVFAVRPLPPHEHDSIEVAPRPGPPWDDLLAQIWPVRTQSVNWPPRLTFTGTGTRHHIGQLLYRWRVGQRATQPIK